MLNPALPGAGEHLQPDRARAGRRGLRRAEPHRARQGARRRLRQPLDHSRRPHRPTPARATCNTRSSPAAPARAPPRTAPPASPVNQSNAKIAPIEIIESEFRPGFVRFDLIRTPAAPGDFRGGLGIRREYLNLEDARFSIRSMKHIIPPNGCAGGKTGRPRRHLDQSGRKGRQAPADPLRRLSAQEGRHLSGSTRRAAAGHGDALEARR